MTNGWQSLRQAGRQANRQAGARREIDTIDLSFHTSLFR